MIARVLVSMTQQGWGARAGGGEPTAGKTVLGGCSCSLAGQAESHGESRGGPGQHQARVSPLRLSAARPRYVSLLPVIPVTLRLNPREALEGRHPQDGRSTWPPPRPGQGGLWEAGPKGPGTAQAHRDLTLYK